MKRYKRYKRIPMQIRLKVGSVLPNQLAVYEEFGRNVPGFQRITDRDADDYLLPPTSKKEKARALLKEQHFKVS
jgi:hypothetical protein